MGINFERRSRNLNHGFLSGLHGITRCTAGWKAVYFKTTSSLPSIRLRRRKECWRNTCHPRHVSHSPSSLSYLPHWLPCLPPHLHFSPRHPIREHLLFLVIFSHRITSQRWATYHIITPSIFSTDIIFPVNISKEQIAVESDDEDSKQMIMVVLMARCSQFKEQKKMSAFASRWRDIWKCQLKQYLPVVVSFELHSVFRRYCKKSNRFELRYIFYK